MVFRTAGAQGVGIVNAMRGATIALASHAFFCSPHKPLQCLTPFSAVSAATVTAGGIIWVNASGSNKVRQARANCHGAMQALLAVLLNDS